GDTERIATSSASEPTTSVRAAPSSGSPGTGPGCLALRLLTRQRQLVRVVGRGTELVDHERAACALVVARATDHRDRRTRAEPSGPLEADRSARQPGDADRLAGGLGEHRERALVAADDGALRLAELRDEVQQAAPRRVVVALAQPRRRDVARNDRGRDG